MLSRLSDYYRIVNPNPPDSLITQRRDAIVDFLPRLTESETRWGCIDIAAFDLRPSLTGMQATTIDYLVAAIKSKQPSFTSDVVANALDLRVCAGVALGEYIATKSAKDAAALVISAIGTRPLPEERHLADFTSALLTVARQALEAGALEARTRPALEIVDVAGTDPGTIAKNLNSTLSAFNLAVNQNLQADREELQILWWIFGGQTTTLSKPFQSIDLGQRALAAGIELAELVLLPPGPNSAQFIFSVLQEDRGLKLSQIVSSCGTDLLQPLSKKAKVSEALLRDCPALLPLTWLGGRLIDSGMAPGWEMEFERKTHISPNVERMAALWASQVFNECVAARLLVATAEA